MEGVRGKGRGGGGFGCSRGITNSLVGFKQGVKLEWWEEKLRREVS
jgi:hypothetical protein